MTKELKASKPTKLIERPNVGKLTFPLPLYKSTPLADVEGRDGTKFILYAGLSENHVAILKKLSLDETDKDIQELTSDRKRFGEGSYEDWYSKGRTPFVIVEPNSGALAALFWLGPKTLGEKSMRHLTDKELEKLSKIDPGDAQTMAYRSYPPYRGVGIMKVFLNFALSVYSKHYPKALIWAIIDSSNPASLGLAKAIGFVELSAEVEEDTHVIMVKK